MSYEFSATENEIIRKAGSRTKIWGILTLAGGILTALMGLAAAMSGETFGIVAGVIYALLALIPIIIGRSFMEAGNALGAAVTTAGSDIDHLMTALTGLSKAFIIQIVAAAVWGGILILGIVAAIALPSFLS
ncbi:MAG: hypothetical protein O2958_13565 [Gemmatimonadetes bacterium]|nr:hypothetical protein [Gemmatimonadota bacterium]MDA1103252.1 hypothetical protein [Gemmatimonadota bacterium]